MKNLFFICFATITLVACNDPNTEPDVVANDYYFDYVSLYKGLDSVGIDSTLIRLDAYLQKYPEMGDAVLFKAYLLAQKGNLLQADVYFEEARSLDTTKIEVYEQWTAYLLKDSSKWNQANKLITAGMALGDSSAILFNNSAWYHILNNSPKEASENISRALMLDTTSNRYHLTAAIISFQQQNSEKLNYHLVKATENGSFENDSVVQSYFDSTLSTFELYNAL